MGIVDDPKKLNPTLRADGQQEDYLVLPATERAKGFVVPYRDSYKHVGTLGPRYPLRDLTDDEKATFADEGFVKFEVYPEGAQGSAVGTFWTQKQLDAVGKGCQAVTRMGSAIAETYARQPEHYGATFCVGCRVHLPVGARGEFVWLDGARVGTREVPVERGNASLAETMVRSLNGLIQNPDVRADLSNLWKCRVPVSDATLNHPTIQCWSEDKTVGFLGVLNGMCGLIGGFGPRSHWGMITAKFSDSGELLEFERTKETE